MKKLVLFIGITCLALATSYGALTCSTYAGGKVRSSPVTKDKPCWSVSLAVMTCGHVLVAQRVSMTVQPIFMAIKPIRNMHSKHTADEPAEHV